MKDFIAKLLQKNLPLKQEEILSLIEVPPSSELGDFAFPCFSLARHLKKNPNQIATDLAQNLKSKEFERIEAKGPYVNFYVDRKAFSIDVLAQISKQKEKFGEQKISSDRVMIEFSQPNTHKAFHIGHVRGTSLGESLARIMDACGNKVVRANYSGDTGMHIAKWLWCYKKFHSKEKLKDDEEWIAAIYVDAVKRLADDESLQLEVEEINRKLESEEDKSLTDLWKKTRTASINSWKGIYKELNTRFDKHYFESQVESPAKEIATKLVQKGIAKISDGATIIDFKDYKKGNLGVFLLLRKDGTVLYGGKDLALAEKKFKEYNPTKSYHVIGRAQDLYIHQVFETFRLMKSPAADKSFYIPVTEVRLPTGKMSSRTGENVLYSSFKKELVELASEEISKREKISQAELKKRSLAIAISALKYAMLKQDTNKTITFDKEEATRFEGNTGPYLLYTYARARSILRKAGYKSSKIRPKEVNDKEKQLVLELSKFPETVRNAYENLAPNVIANYAYQLAQSFNEFYHASPVIGSGNERFRLALVDSFSQTLKNALTLLGIQTLEKM